MKVRNIVSSLFLIGGIFVTTVPVVCAHDYDYKNYYDYYRRPNYDMPNYTDFYGGNNYICQRNEFPRFSFDSRDRVVSNWMYRTNQFEIATLGCRISKNNGEQIAFYQGEAQNYLNFLRARRITTIYSINGERLDPRAIKKLYFFLQNGALIAEFEY